MTQIRHAAMLVLLLPMIIVIGCDSTAIASDDGPTANLTPAPCDPDEEAECDEGSPPPPQPPGPPPTGLYVGDTSCAWGDQDCNLCVDNVPVRFNQIRDHGEVLGFRTNGFNLNINFDIGDPHLQGIQRLRSGNGQYFVVTKSDDRNNNSETSFVVEMGSRNTSGARFRSNRLSTTINRLEHTAPLASDQVARLNDMPYTPHPHGGGAQALGNVLAMASEGNAPSIKGRVYLYDYSSPTNPHIIGQVEGRTSSVGATALTKLSDGRFLLAMGRPSDKIEFYHSNGSNLLANMTWSYLGTKTMVGVVSGWPDTSTGGYQTLNFITDCSGRLYMVGIYNSHPWSIGADYVDLYYVSSTSGPLPAFTKIAEKHMYCSNNGGDNMCNFDAGAGVYVTPDRRLLLYAVEHEDSGPEGSVTMVEFRSIYPSLTCSNINDAFVDFYDDDDFTDRGFLVDYVDRDLKNDTFFPNFDEFNDKASAVRFCIPQNWKVRVYQTIGYQGSSFDLVGTGFPASWNLKANGFNDRASSMKWIYDPFS